MLSSAERGSVATVSRAEVPALRRVIPTAEVAFIAALVVITAAGLSEPVLVFSLVTAAATPIIPAEPASVVSSAFEATVPVISSAARIASIDVEADLRVFDNFAFELVGHHIDFRYVLRLHLCHDSLKLLSVRFRVEQVNILAIIRLIAVRDEVDPRLPEQVKVGIPI